MTEREKVIKGLECCVLRDPDDKRQCDDCPYRHPDGVITNSPCVNGLMGNALSLLKAQEPVKPYIDYDGQDVLRCGSCGATLFHLSHTQADEIEQNCVKFCRYCGQAVKWDG